MSDNCNSCGGGSTVEGDVPLPTADSNLAIPAPPPSPCPPTPAPIKQLCSQIKDQCHCEPSAPQPVSYIANTIAFSIPACNQVVEVTFDKDVSGIMPGLELYAVDVSQQTIRLRVISVVPLNKLVLKNECSSCCSGTKPIGEAVLTNTKFTWAPPQCCASSGAAVTGQDCLVGTFFFPAVGATSPANVGNAFNLALGGIYSLGGFLWKVTSRVTTTQVLLENVAPGNGSVVGGFIDGGTDGTCVYPFTPVADVDECSDAPVSEVVLSGCTPTGKKKLTGTADCGLVSFNKSTGNFSVRPLLGGSSNSGPHYVDYNPTNPCASKLVYAPQLQGANCANTLCAVYLTPANASNLYEVEVSTTAYFTAGAPNNIVTLSGRQFQIEAIVTGGAPGKLRIRPRFVVTVSETIPAQSPLCVVEGCQPFPATLWPFACPLDTVGQPVFCATDGLRTAPPVRSTIAAIPYGEAVDININNAGNHDRFQIDIPIINPSPCYAAVAYFGYVQYGTFRLNADGIWGHQVLYSMDSDPLAVWVGKTFRQSPGSDDGEERGDMIAFNQVFSLTPGQTRTVHLKARVQTANPSTQTPAALWTNLSGALHIILISQP